MVIPQTLTKRGRMIERRRGRRKTETVKQSKCFSEVVKEKRQMYAIYSE